LLSKTRSALRAAVRQAKTRVKHAVAAAKEAWWSKHVSNVNAIRSSATAWESVKMLRAGLKKARKGSTRAMRWNVSVEHPAGELGDGSAEINAAIFHDHFKQLYGRLPSGKMGVLQHVEQQRVFTELDHEPTEAEILEAVLGKHGRGGLNCSGPGDTGVAAAEWKALMADDECRGFVVAYVRRFWRSKVNPQAWITGLLKILEKKGDLSMAGNYRGIMMLEVPYKVVANVLKVRLGTIFESLGEHVESQNGFRMWRGCPDGIWNLKSTLRKLKAGGHECWLLLLDLVKAFDRCDRALLWAVMERLGVPPTVLLVLKALHEEVVVKFDVDGVEQSLPSIIGVKQGDILGPVLFLFLVAGFQMAWRKVRTTTPPTLYTRPDGVMDRRQSAGEGSEGRGGAEQVRLSETLYADDTGAYFLSREDLEKDTPLLFQLLEDFGLEAHSRPPGSTKESKTLVVFLAKPRPFYKDYSKLVLHGAGRGADLSDVDVGRGRTIHVAESAKYLGSIVHRDGSDRPDVLARIKSARGAFGCLRKCLFSRKDVTYEGKRKVYEGLVLAILFYSSECWCLRESELQELHSFHQDCVRTMCRISMWHVEQYSITNQELLDRLGLQTMDTYLARRQLQWLGHVWRMDWTRLPRKLLTAWVPVEETWVGGRELTWGESVEKKLKRASHAFLSVDDESTLCAEALPFVPQSLVVTAGTGRRRRQRQQQQRKASGWTYHGQVGSWNGVWLPPPKEQQPQQPQRPSPLRVLRRLPQRQRPLQVAPPPPGPPPPPPQAHTTGLRRSGRTRRRVTPASTQYATSSSSSSGVDDGRCDDGEFALDLAEVAEEAAVERKEVRRVKPLLSELQVPEWQELAKDRRKWRKMLKSIKIRR